MSEDGSFWSSTPKNNIKVFIQKSNIHFINYTHFDREQANFDNPIFRYWLLLYSYAEQLRVIVGGLDEQLINIVNNTYLHKILVHSPRIFLFYNLASYSAEQGESNISVSNRLLKANAVYNDKKPSKVKLFGYLILRQEAKIYSIFTSKDSSSRVWEDNDFNIVKLKIIKNPRLTNLLNDLKDKKLPYLVEFNCPTWRFLRNNKKTYLTLNHIVAYGEQWKDKMPCSLGKENDCVEVNGLTIIDLKEIVQNDNQVISISKLDNEKRILEKHKNSLQKSENIVKNILTTLVQHSDRWDKLCNEFKSLVNDIPEPISPVINYINFDKDVKNLKEELFELYEADDESLFEKFDDVTNFTSKNIEFYNVLKGNISVVNRIFEKESNI